MLVRWVLKDLQERVEVTWEVPAVRPAYAGVLPTTDISPQHIIELILSEFDVKAIAGCAHTRRELRGPASDREAASRRRESRPT
jgi:hypothetical protein